MLELEKYVRTTLGAGGWETLMESTGLAGKVYLATLAYPDDDLLAVVSAASAKTGMPPAAIQEDFGQFLALAVVPLFQALTRPEWKTLDLIEHTREIHQKLVRVLSKAAKPPDIDVTRLRPDEVVVHYGSPRRMCAVLKGMVAGIARHYGQRVTIREIGCMHSGAAKCEVLVRVVE